MTGKITGKWLAIAITVTGALLAQALLTSAHAADDRDLLFKKSIVWRALTPNDKLAVYGMDDPVIEGVACHYTLPEIGGVSGTLGMAEEVSDISISCRQYGQVKFKEKFEQGSEVFRERRSLVFKRMHIVRSCDPKRNIMVYMVYSDRPIEGSPKNSTSSFAIQPWGGEEAPQRCSDWLK
ncbi:CreA family protein [Hohaiivirga grylli]|uniref:CreA family protein n=1 Tax=Hohaiivirga grylli TaxID=3133970 RepID=UPI00387EA2FC